jgi:hypothetical protein
MNVTKHARNPSYQSARPSGFTLKLITSQSVRHMRKTHTATSVRITKAPITESGPQGVHALTLTSFTGCPDGVLRFRDIFVERCWKW